jgi:HK97 family phage major capsid protein
MNDLFNFLPTQLLMDKDTEGSDAGGGSPPADPDMPGLDDMINKAVEKAVEGIVKSIGAKMESAMVTPSQKTLDMERTGGFANIGEFTKSVALFSSRMPLDKDPEKAAQIKALMETRVGGDGGILVPPEYSNQLFSLAEKKSAIWSRATKLPVMGNSISLPSISNYTNADDSYYGGIVNYWVQEGSTGTEVQPRFDMINFRLHDNMTLVPITNDLLQDSPVTIAPLIETMASNAIALSMDNVIINGDGVGKPQGMLNANCKISITKEDDQTAATIVTANLTKMFARFNMEYLNGAIFMANQTILPQLIELNIASGTAGALVYMPPGGLSSAPMGTLFGVPIQYTQFCKALGTEGDIILANPSQFLAIEKSGSAEWSKEVYFVYNKSLLRVMYRADGHMWQNKVFTPANGDTLAPIVSLATRS